LTLLQSIRKVMICGSQEYILEQKVSEIVDEISRRAPGNFELVKLARGVDEVPLYNFS